MKKTLITIIVIVAIGAIGYAGYEFSSNHSTSTTKPEVASTTGAVQASTTTNSDTTANSDTTTKTAQPEKSKETAVIKTTTNNTNEKTSDNKNSDSTIAAYVPTKVIDYAKPSNSSSNTQNKDENSSTSKKAEAPASQNVSTSNTTTSSSSNKTTTSNAEPTQTTAKPSQPVAQPSTKPTQPVAPPAQPVAPPAQPVAPPAQPVAPPTQTAPIISATDVVIPQGSSFNWGLVKASTNQPNTRILFSGAVNTSQPGKYPILIQAINQQGLKSKKYINVIVEKANVPSLPAPVIAGSNIIIGQGGLYNPGMLDVHATVDGNSVPVTYSGTVDNNKPGIYTVTATATNSQGVSTSKEFTVQVIHVQQ
ncbi:MAG: immunoglobulin-like domain-containing protein [Sarcina sp.]